ncbi:MAG TPA: hypothetical protein VK445_01460 [Dissulfurispiraceae bacterium]|nr:hypothetical protein [Dissulfurispiraceae bacterium]
MNCRLKSAVQSFVIMFLVCFMISLSFASHTDIPRAKSVLAAWNERPQVGTPPAGCEKCNDLYNRIAEADGQGQKLAGESRGIMAALEAPNADQSQRAKMMARLDEVTNAIEEILINRKASFLQYDRAVAEFRMLKQRPDDKRVREESVYDNPMRAR